MLKLFMLTILMEIIDLVALPFMLPSMIKWILDGIKIAEDPYFRFGDTYPDLGKGYDVFADLFISWAIAASIRLKLQEKAYKHTHKNPAD